MADFNSVNDFNLLGIGALRREALRARSEPLVLQTHPDLVPAENRLVYEQSLQELQAWLQPQEIRKIDLGKTAPLFLETQLTADFRQYFPQTAARISSGLENVLHQYHQDFPWQGGLLTVHFRYFSSWLKSQPNLQNLAVIAHREWLWAYLGFADFGESSRQKKDLNLNPSLQIFRWEALPEKPEMISGLYALVYWPQQKHLVEISLDIFTAALLDLLQEDRKFTQEQLIEQALLLEIPQNLTRQEWLKKLFYLVEHGIIATSISSATRSDS